MESSHIVTLQTTLLHLSPPFSLPVYNVHMSFGNTVSRQIKIWYTWANFVKDYRYITQDTFFFHYFILFYYSTYHASYKGGGPRVVEVWKFERNKNVSSPSTCESQYCGEPPWPRGSVLGLRPPGLEFRILSGGQCHLNHLTILRRFSWSSLAYMCTKVA